MIAYDDFMRRVPVLGTSGFICLFCRNVSKICQFAPICCLLFLAVRPVYDAERKKNVLKTVEVAMVEV